MKYINSSKWHGKLIDTNAKGTKILLVIAGVALCVLSLVIVVSGLVSTSIFDRYVELLTNIAFWSSIIMFVMIVVASIVERFEIQR